MQETAQAAEQAHAAEKTGRLVAAETTVATTGTAVATVPVQVPTGMMTAVLEKGARVHVLALPTGASAIEAQNQSVLAAIAAEKTGVSTTQALAVAPTSTIQNAGGLQAINMATANQAVTKPLTDPTALSAPSTAVAMKAGLPDDVAATYAAIPTPRPRIAPAGTSTMVAYAAPGNQSISGLSNDFFPPAPGGPLPETAAASTPTLNKLIKRYAGMYGVPESLVHRVVHRESRYDPKAYNKRGFWGLMQIKYATAKSMGYEGPPEGLLDAETNLKYAIKYLRGAWLVADNDSSNAIRLYARGYYYDAKRKDMLHVLR
jgi:soluble lytic murein transglycosylase-like protein